MKWQFELWRLLASVTCWGIAVGLFRFTYLQIESYGGGLFPAACIVIALLLMVAGVGLIFRRTWELLFYALFYILRLLLALISP